jgi:transcriptional regulator GlxA family with amidase domain
MGILAFVQTSLPSCRYQKEPDRATGGRASPGAGDAPRRRPLPGADEAVDIAKTRHRHAAVIVRFEEVLTKHIDWKLNMQALCAEVGVAERTLRMCCAEVLGVSPTRYVLLRRLNRARAALRRADPSTATVAEVARNNQFMEFGRFAVTYRSIFGESPSTTLQRNSSE